MTEAKHSNTLLRPNFSAKVVDVWRHDYSNKHTSNDVFHFTNILFPFSEYNKTRIQVDVISHMPLFRRLCQKIGLKAYFDAVFSKIVRPFRKTKNAI